MMKSCALLAVAMLATGCRHHSGAGAPDLAFVEAFAPHDKIDILFLIGNEASTSQYQLDLANHFPLFVKALEQAAATHPASYHIGVVTADLGAGPYTFGNGICHPGGDGGKLQVGPKSGPFAAPCPSVSFSGGVRFIDWDQVAGTTNILGGVSLLDAFACMSSPGDLGCGFQHQLEATYWALHEDIPENAGFLRADALLVVVYLTDEDDCSGTTDDDLFDPSPDGVARYGPLHSFRCAQFGITCGAVPMPLPSTPIDARADCQPLASRDGGKLIDVQKYIDFFSKPGGVKADPSDVILVSIAPPPAPFSTHLTSPCSDSTTAPSCLVLDPSCVAPTNPVFFGNPAVRLATVIQSAATSQSTSSCDVDYTPALADLAQKIIARLK